MKRAVRSIRQQPSLRRRHRRLDQTHAFDNTQQQNWQIPHRQRRHKHSFSSITFDSSDNGVSIDIHNGGHGVDNRNATRPKHRNGQKQRQGQLQRQGQRKEQQSLNASRRSDISVFATIHEAQDSMQNLLDRLVAIDTDAISNSNNGFSPITVQNLAWNGENDDDANRKDCDFDYRLWKERTSVFREAGYFFDTLVRSVDEGLLSPSRKHGKDLSQLAECLLYVCSQQHPCHTNSTNKTHLSFPITNTTDDDNDNDKLRRDNTSLDTSEVMGAIEKILKVLEVDWNLDVSRRHYKQAIAAACNWREWDVASALFEKQIDPNAGGSPVLLSIENPLALYAMTQQYQQQRQRQRQQNSRNDNGGDLVHSNSSHQEEHVSMVAEQIMDAVQRLVMVSPQDQDTYVLAAGNALGYAGCWRELNDFRKSSLLSQQYGTSLVAAVLRACLLCGEYEAALEILVEENILSPSLMFPLREMQGSYPNDSNDPFSASSSSSSNLEEEWQWGGSRDRMDPLIRDLAMQVIGGASTLVACDETSNDDGELRHREEMYEFCDSRLAQEFFRQSLEEGVTISQEALLGVTEACERDKDWRGALSVLRTILEANDNSNNDYNANNNTLQPAPWIVPSDALSIVERDQLGASDMQDAPVDARNVLANLGPVLASVMRNCNSVSNFGLSLFALRLFQTQLLRSSNTSISSNANDDPLSPEEGIVRMLSELNIAGSSHDHDELLVASMVALSGLRCNKSSMRLYERTTRDLGGESAMAGSSSASLMYQYASLNQKRYGTSVLGNPWLSAHGHIDRLTEAGFLARNIMLRGTTNDTEPSENERGGFGLPERQREGIEEILARAMNSCTSAHQPELSLYLLEWMKDSVFSRRRDAQSAWSTRTHKNSIGGTTNAKEICYGDSVTAETILALRWTKDLTGANEMFEGLLEKHSEDDLVKWRKTIVAGLTAMVASGRGNDAVKVFEVLDGDARSTACYTTIGRHLSKVKDWKELIDLYGEATAEGYSSEELSLLAMMAVTSTRVDNRLRILRAIVDDCATGAGLDSKRWTMAKYWELKRRLGFYHARLLMWWNDEERAQLDEVNLAIKEFYNEKANGMRPKNDVVRAIFTGAKHHNRLGLEQQNGYEKVPRSVDHWAELLSEVLRTVRESSVRYDPNFVDSVVSAYNSLGKHGECVDYVSGVLEAERTRLRRSTLEDALVAAKAEQAFGVYENIQMLLSRGTTTAAAAAGPNQENGSASYDDTERHLVSVAQSLPRY